MRPFWRSASGVFDLAKGETRSNWVIAVKTSQATFTCNASRSRSSSRHSCQAAACSSHFTAPSQLQRCVKPVFSRSSQCRSIQPLFSPAQKGPQPSISNLLLANKNWAKEMTRRDPEYFSRLANQQKPKCKLRGGSWRAQRCLCMRSGLHGHGFFIQHRDLYACLQLESWVRP